jgi:hypothetical protein
MKDGTLWHILNGIIAIMEKLSGEVIFSLRFFSQDISHYLNWWCKADIILKMVR